MVGGTRVRFRVRVKVRVKVRVRVGGGTRVSDRQLCRGRCRGWPMLLVDKLGFLNQFDSKMKHILCVVLRVIEGMRGASG